MTKTTNNKFCKIVEEIQSFTNYNSKAVLYYYSKTAVGNRPNKETTLLLRLLE